MPVGELSDPLSSCLFGFRRLLRQKAVFAVPANRILAALSPADYERLAPNLVPVELPLRMCIERRNRPTEFIHFLESGIASVVSGGDRAAEVGIIGKEGFTGLAVVLGSDARPTHDTFVQAVGAAHRIDVRHVRFAIESSFSLHCAMLDYVHSFLRQVTETAIANNRHKLEERLARWLLMAQDRLDSPNLQLTHEFLGVMLGTARPGVTLALQELERGGWVSTRRGIVTVMDRNGLIELSNGAYNPQ